jgi:DNA polymerase III delta subunit
LATFPQWRERFPEGKRLVYICGADRALVSEVYKSELSYRPIHELDYVVHDGKDHISDIMASLSQYSKGGMRLVVIHNSDLIKKWEPIIEWTTSRMKDTTLLCVGNEVKPDTKQAYFRPFVEKGRFIECKPLNDEQMLDYIVRSGKFTKLAAETLVRRTGGSMFRILNEMKKLEYLPPPVTPEVVEEYVLVSESDQLVDALFANDKKAAMHIAESLDQKELGFILGSLEYALSNLVLLVSVRDRQASAVDISERTGIPMFLMGKYFAWAKGVTTNVLYKRIKLLANVDALSKRGHTTGVLERLIVLW